MKRVFNALALPLIVSLLIVLGWWLLKDVQMDVLAPSGEVAIQQRNLLLFTIGLSALVVVPVFILLAVISLRYRRSNKSAVYQPDWAHSWKLETIWWGIPIAIILVLAAVTWYTSHSLDPYRKIESANKTINVQVMALQWKWLFLYPDYGIATLNQLPVPANTPLSFTLSADAPMSAFWVPALGSQIYSMNGMSSQLNLIANKSGDYRGYSTNINGKGYSDMTFTVHATPKAKFDRWVKKTQASKEDMTLDRYEELSKPGVKKGEFAYRLSNTGLYDTIVDKYMGHSNLPHHDKHRNTEEAVY